MTKPKYYFCIGKPIEWKTMKQIRKEEEMKIWISKLVKKSGEKK